MMDVRALKYISNRRLPHRESQPEKVTLIDFDTLSFWGKNNSERVAPNCVQGGGEGVI